MKIAISFITLVGVTLISGCAHQIAQDRPQALSTKHIFLKNYQLGETKRASVGEPIIQIKDYYATTVGQSNMVASESFTVDGTFVHQSFNQGQVIPVKGQVNISGKNFAVLPIDGNPLHFKALLVDDDGVISNKLATNGNEGLITMIYTYSIIPSSVRMNREISEKVLTEKGYQNYEVLYNGSDKNSMFFTYREFSPDGIAKTAFYQNLTYEAKAKTIKFKNFKINVTSSNNEGIEYVITEDSISN